MAHLKGKAHIRPGFDYWYSFIGQGEYFDPMINDNGNEYREKGYMTDILTDKMLEWLDNQRDPNKPFYLNLWHKGVHEDHSPAPRHEKLYTDRRLPTPPYDTHLETFVNKPEWQRVKAYDSAWKSLRWPCHRHRDGVFRRGDRVTERRVHHHHAFARRRLDVDIVDPDPGAANDFQIVRRSDHISIRLTRGADHKTVKVRDFSN